MAMKWIQLVKKALLKLISNQKFKYKLIKCKAKIFLIKINKKNPKFMRLCQNLIKGVHKC